MKAGNTVQLDKIDQNIIRQMRQNARITVTDLAEKVGISKTPCLNRLKRLERDGYILGYTALINHTKLAAGHIAYVQVTVSDTRSEALNAFNDAVRKIPEVTQCHMMAASFDYLLKVRTKDMTEYRTVLGEKISSLPHVSHTSTFAVMETVVDPGTD
ncbi:Lrp/AsnC family transcriptional regulator [Gimibacter soli]|uniref:Lrp/AsnC ligand binding domain-containing protein n=1 Tax=Gimibacter soli TaxID=3024400 RepID=A0AAE9XMP7_9PROT|nr:Lrp/AsnC ligand binding domain-containing protein [Gimibacter soli]WCL53802.1 Lrp/AsnC ligand binding domain-containing protein [Gimibacter soli]